MSKSRLIAEFFEFVKTHKKLWLIPLLILLAIVGAVIITAQSQALAPFLYSLF